MTVYVDCSNFMAQVELADGLVDRFRCKICPRIIFLTSTPPEKSLLQVIEKAFSSYTGTFQIHYLNLSALLLLPETDEPLLLQIFQPLKQGYWLGWLEKNGVWKSLKLEATYTVLPPPRCFEYQSLSME